MKGIIRDIQVEEKRIWFVVELDIAITEWEAEGYDFTLIGNSDTGNSIIGFWTDKGRCTQEITDFLNTLKGKEVFLFGTAGFGGSQEYFDKILSSVQKRLGASNTVIGTYMCQGKMPQSVRERYVKMKNSPLPIPNVDKMIENFDTAVSHPDETDLQKLKYAVAQCIKC